MSSELFEDASVTALLWRRTAAFIVSKIPVRQTLLSHYYHTVASSYPYETIIGQWQPSSLVLHDDNKTMSYNPVVKVRIERIKCIFCSFY